MIQSMTGFARQQTQGPFGVITVEIRTVNHRFLDMTLRMPEGLRMFDNDVREAVRTKLNRGKVDINVRFEPGEGATDMRLNPGVAKQLVAACEELRGLISGASEINLTELLQWPGVLHQAEVDEGVLKTALLDVVNAALNGLIDTRTREGQVLKGLIEERLTQLTTHAAELKPILQDIKQAQHDKLVARLEEANIPCDSGRLEQELVMWAQRTDVAEELDRLTAHVSAVRQALNKGGAQGRRLDFLMQELNRESNTLSSKSVSLDTTNAAVDMKVLIEQMREQVQNIE